MATGPETQSPKPRKWRKPLVSGHGGPSIWVQLTIAFAVFLVLSAGYSLVREYIVSEDNTVSLSQIVADINAGTISSIVVEGTSVTAVYKDGSEKTSRKESEASITETFANYGLAPEKIGAVEITVQDEGGARYWFLTLAPLLIPVFLILGIIWYLSRQVKGAGMQAFTFGRSMARLVNPEDEVQKVTFA